MANIYDLRGRQILITGASSGIGTQLSMRLAQSGASVALAARRRDSLEELAAKIETAGGTAVAIELDVTSEASVKAAYDQAERAIGVIDTIIANAGLLVCEPALKLSVEDFDRVMEVNVRGTFLTVREGARRMIAAGLSEGRKGRAIIISSVGASKVLPTNAAYGSSKAALRFMSKVLALEWAKHGINVNAILPGMIRTEMTQDTLDNPMGQSFVSRLPRQEEMDISALDGTVMMLCSEDARYMTGAEILVDDGQSIMF